GSGQPSVENGHSADENHVSSTSSLRRSAMPLPNLASASSRASSSLSATKTVPSSAYHAGIWCPHHSWRDMHHGWMLRIHSKNVFSHCRGTKTVCPVSTAAIAGSASTLALQYHWSVSHGSMMTPERS